MSKHEKLDADWGDLAEAARALAGELQRFEALTVVARRMSLDTHRGIERAAKATTETAARQQGVDLALGALVQAIQVVRERHEANVNALQARGEEIRQRAAQYAALSDRWSALGEEGAVINQLVHEVAAKQRDVAPAAAGELIAAIVEIEARMSSLVDGARELEKAAATASITDVAERAGTLTAQMIAARNKMGLVRKGLRVEPPDPSTLN